MTKQVQLPVDTDKTKKERRDAERDAQRSRFKPEPAGFVNGARVRKPR